MTSYKKTFYRATSWIKQVLQSQFFTAVGEDGINLRLS